MDSVFFYAINYGDRVLYPIRGPQDLRTTPNRKTMSTTLIVVFWIGILVSFAIVALPPIDK